jgi:uncharacterized membrane protein YfcA
VTAAIAVAAGAVAQAVSGFGFSLVCAPFLIATLGRTQGVRLNLLLSVVLNVALLLGDRRARWPVVVTLLVPAAIATPLFAWAFDGVSGRALAIAAGGLTIASAVALGAGLRLRHAGGRIGALVTGVVSAFMNTLAGIGGPPVAMFAVNAEWPEVWVRPTLQAYFLGLNLVALATLGLPKAAVSPWIGLAFGWALGRVALARLPQRATRPAILAVAALGGLLAITRAHG